MHILKQVTADQLRNNQSLYQNNQFVVLQLLFNELEDDPIICSYYEVLELVTSKETKFCIFNLKT